MSKKHVMLIYTDAKANNNKFYEVTLEDDENTINLAWGRVGAAGQTKTTFGGLREFTRLVNSKIRKGYEETKTINMKVSLDSDNAVSNLGEVAKSQLIDVDTLSNSKETAKLLLELVEKLTKLNKHQLSVASGGNITISDDGIISTPLGMVTIDTINKARKTLNKIERYVEKKDLTNDQYIDLLEKYLKLIPQKVPARQGWFRDFFTNFSSLIAQGQLLDQLESSIDLYDTKKEEAINKLKSAPKVEEKLFNVKIELVTDPKIIQSIQDMYTKTQNSRHISSKLKLKRVYEIKNEKSLENFEKVAAKIGNVKRLWHGTRAFNLLSILKSGLIIPKSGGSYHITGRMFGDGLYFSDQSTKALNYSYGYWDNNAKDTNCFMFVADVAMGREFKPQGYGGYSNFKPEKHNCDSLFAEAGVGGVMNNEMIVYTLEQAYLRYLCEFSD